MTDSANDRPTHVVDVLIAGAGPVGLTLANFLAMQGVSCLIIDQGASLIDYPRGVGIDDECLRTFQAAGLADSVTAHTTPNHWMRFMTAKGRCFASIEPRTDDFGWPRRNAFVQPLVDRVLFAGLERFSHAQVKFGNTLTRFTDHGDHVEAITQTADGEESSFHARFLIGCDGGRSTVRSQLGLGFDGSTESTKWLVVDIENDPLGIPNAYLHCNPARPYVSIALPHGIRRFEFMVMPGETEEQIVTPEKLHELLGKVCEHPERLRLIRSRVYTHHARLASQFRVGSVLIAGDAAHLMPVWQGQGYNSGIRDAFNLGWKLSLVVKNLCAPQLLDTYEQERRPHARAMIAISQLAGRIFSPTTRIAAWTRDVVLLLLNAVPPVKRYLLQMRFKPMPSYDCGAIVPERDPKPSTPVGKLFIQPRVSTTDGRIVLLDEAVGPGLAVLGWNIDPARDMDDAARALCARLDVRLFVVKPTVAIHEPVAMGSSTITLGDCTGRIKEWFGAQRGSIVFLRPDRFVGAISTPENVTALTHKFAAALSYIDPESRMR